MSQVKTFPDSILLLQVSEGSEQSFSQLFTHYYRILRPFILKFIKSENDTEEILQETFVRIWLSRDKLPEIENLDGWIYRIASRECISYVRKNRLRQPEFTNLEKCHQLPVSKQVSPLDKLGTDEMRRAIDELVENMPSQRKRIFRLSREEGLKPAEIASLLNLSVSTVKNTLSTALKEIRSHLIHRGFESFAIFLAYISGFSSS